MSSTPSSDENTYIIDSEAATETARLMHQDRLATRGMGGVFPEQPDLSNASAILDIACGPGGWVLDVAFAYPDIEVVGIDISYTTIQYAKALARSQGLWNARFQVMNVLQPLQFPDHSFDLVNARFLCPFMPTTAWPRLLAECIRITRPGGIVRLTECDEPATTNSPAYEEIKRRTYQALQRTGQTFAPDGRHYGITPLLSRLLREAGCQQIGLKAHVLDLSTGAEANEGWYQNAMVGFRLLQPFLVTQGVIGPDEFEQLYQQMLIEMLSESFSALWFYLTAWGKTPE